MQRPTFIRMGSRMIAAISPGFSLKRRSTLPRLLKVAILTLSIADFGTPSPPVTGVGIFDVAEVGSVRLHADQSGIMQAVVCAFELDDFVAAGRGAGQANGVHGGFGSAVAEADHLDGKALADFFGEFPFHVMRHAEHGAGGEAFFNGLHDGGMAVPGHERAEGEVVVDVFVAIEVAELAAAGIFYKDGPGLVVAIVAGNAERDALEIFLVRFGGFGRAALESR